MLRVKHNKQQDIRKHNPRMFKVDAVSGDSVSGIFSNRDIATGLSMKSIVHLW
jgi:hypothetical protein